MKKFVCEVCGSRNYIEERGKCWCTYCNAMYTQNYLDKDEIVRIAENAILAQEKRKLYNLVQAKYSDGDKIIDACNGVLHIAPEDRYAQFYLYVYRGYRGDQESLEKIDKILLDIDVNNADNRYFVQDVLDCMIKNIKSDENSLALGLFLDKLKASNLLDKETWHEYQTAIETEITNLRKGVYNAHEHRDAFIMYSSQDIEKVYELVKYLEEKRNTKCFVAARNLRHGGDAVRDFENQLHTAITYCDVMVFVSSKNSCSERCGAMDEVRYILQQERQGMKKKPRVEYLLGKNQKTREVADAEAGRYLNEFFYGKQWCLDKSQLANAIIEEQENLQNSVSIAAAIPVKEVKYCKACGAENDKKVKFCGECGNREFVDTQEEYAKIQEEESTPPTEALLEEWYQKGEDYYYGENGVGKSKAEAAKWYQKAAKHGHAASQYSLGYCYEYGEGVAKDADEAVKWYKKAADQRYAKAQYLYGLCYYFGTGVDEDRAEAVKWFKRAAEQGYDEAQEQLGTCYSLGEGVEVDKAEAKKWYQKAAEQGHANSQYWLGSCYHFGDGVEEDRAEAKKWYQKAAAQGHADAKRKLNNYF